MVDSVSELCGCAACWLWTVLLRGLARRLLSDELNCVVLRVALGEVVALVLFIQACSVKCA